MSLPRLLDVTAAAAYLDVTPEWLGKAAARGEVPSRKVGRARRFTEDDLAEYLDAVRQGNASGRATRGKRAS